MILFRTVVLSKLLYAAPAWLNEHNCLKFKDFYARVCHKISGSTHYSPQAITLLTIGLDPLVILYRIICIKFILKALTSDNNMVGLIFQLEESRSHPFYQHIVMVREYLSLFQETSTSVSCRRNLATSWLSTINRELFRYSSSNIMMLKTHLWNKYMALEADIKSRSIMGHSNNSESDICILQTVEQHKNLFPRNSKRVTDTKVMSLIHGHDLIFNKFKHSLHLSSSPYCSLCPSEIDNNSHRLLYCPKYSSHYRESLYSLSSSNYLAQGILVHGTSTQLENIRLMAQIIFN